MFGLLPYVDRAAGQVPVIQKSVTHYSRLPHAPDQPSLPEFDPLDEVPMSPKIGRAREHPGIHPQSIQKNVTRCHVKFLDSLASIRQKWSRMVWAS
jgi:hypothetical protein